MNTYQRQLLDKLITELTDNASPNLHTAQMLAAELKGAMQAQDAPQKPTPDADGWVENTGIAPDCIYIEGLRFANYSEKKLSGNDRRPGVWSWHLKNHITHYKPA